jgi:hypothetical protein
MIGKVLAVAMVGLCAGSMTARAEDPKPEAPPEAPKAADFTVKDVDGKERKLSEFADKWVVLEWTNYTCPYVKKHYDPGAMQALQTKYVGKGVVWLSICSSGPGLPGNMSPADWKKAIEEKKAKPTAVLLDESGAVGRQYEAKRTPEVRIISPTRTIVYSGAIDDNKDAGADPTKSKNYISTVLDAVLAGKASPIAKTDSYG